MIQQTTHTGKQNVLIAITYMMKTKIDWELWREGAVWFVFMLVFFALNILGNKYL